MTAKVGVQQQPPQAVRWSDGLEDILREPLCTLYQFFDLPLAFDVRED